MKCQYCSVINDKNFGTCDFCGAPLSENEKIERRRFIGDRAGEEMNRACENIAIGYNAFIGNTSTNSANSANVTLGTSNVFLFKEKRHDD